MACLTKFNILFLIFKYLTYLIMLCSMYIKQNQNVLYISRNIKRNNKYMEFFFHNITFTISMIISITLLWYSYFAISLQFFIQKYKNLMKYIKFPFDHFYLYLKKKGKKKTIASTKTYF